MGIRLGERRPTRAWDRPHIRETMSNPSGRPDRSSRQNAGVQLDRSNFARPRICGPEPIPRNQARSGTAIGTAESSALRAFNGTRSQSFRKRRFPLPQGKLMFIANAVVCVALSFMPVDAHSADVTATIHMVGKDGKSDPSGVVLSLTPLDPARRAALKEAPIHATLVQKHKSFSPHLLVVPPGSTVDFPNKDPFFHNVFSLFEGKRFDLGL